MSNETCGTCGRVNGKFCLCLTNMTALGCEVCLRPEETEACEKWSERTDSLEQVALDAAKKNCCFCDYWDGAKMEPACDPCFADRLRALGVEVPQ